MSSLQVRYVAKLTSNIVGLAASSVIVLLVPRALGAAAYGAIEFLVAIFTSVIGIVDVGTSNGYYAWLSRRPRDAGLVRGYGTFAMGAGAAILLFVFAAFGLHAPASWLWPNFSLSLVIAGFLAAWFLWIQQLVQKTVDAVALTTIGEMLILTARISGALFIGLAAVLHLLNFNAYLGYLIALPFVTSLLLMWALRRVDMAGGRMWFAVLNAPVHWRALAKDFDPYVRPMLALAIFTALSTMADRLLLEHFGGAAQQGLYSLGSRIAALCFVFSGAMTQLLTREFAIAFERGDRDEIRRIFTRYVPPLYAVSSVIALFVAWHARTIVTLFGGRDFSQGTLALTILAFYPMHQTLGQLAGAVYYGTAAMAKYSWIQILSLFLGFPVLWLLVMPGHLGGFALGSVGLAMKLVAIQIVGVNFLLFFITRTYEFSFMSEIRFQVLSPLACLPVVAVSAMVADATQTTGFINLIVAATFYTALIAITVLVVPRVFGIRRGDLHRMISLVLALFES